jgi:hypothetical protein
MRAAIVGRRAVFVAVAASLVVSSPIFAQTGERVMESGRTPRKVVFPFIGAAIGGLASLVYFAGGPGRSPHGACSKQICVGTVTLVSGALVGWLVGKEKDELHQLRYRGGRALKPAPSSLTLTGEPQFLTVNDSVGAAYGVGGVQLFSTKGKPDLIGVRAPGLLNVTEASLVTAEQRFALTASGGLYRFPLGQGLGSRLRPAPAGTVSAYKMEYLVGSGTRIERVPANAENEAPSWPGLRLDDTVRAIKPDAKGNIWALTSSSLYALRPESDSFSVVGRIPLPSGARRLDVQGSMLAVALGDSGVRFFDVAEPAQPKTITEWRGTAFVYDVALDNGVAYVASGIDGLARITIGSTPRLDGLARELGFIVAVSARAPDIWVLDRSGAAVVRKVSMSDMK